MRLNINPSFDSGAKQDESENCSSWLEFVNRGLEQRRPTETFRATLDAGVSVLEFVGQEIG
jgi:hypothetical protein